MDKNIFVYNLRKIFPKHVVFAESQRQLRWIMQTQKKHITGFSILGSPSNHQQKIFHSSPPRKITHTKFLFLPTPTTKQFSCYNQIKNSILSCRHCSCSIVLTSYSLETQVMLILILINIQDSQKAVSSFEKGWNRQNHSSSTPLPPVKCLILSTPLGKIYLLPPLTIIWKTLHLCKKCFVNSKRLYS